jgi:GTP-binding protein
LVHLVEPFPLDGGDPLRNYHTIRNELTLYSQKLAEKPEILCVSKAELPGADRVRQDLQAGLGREVLLISSVTGQGLSQLVGAAAKELANVKHAEREALHQAPTLNFGTQAVIRTQPESQA